ncbi:methyltransferase domain-containing protein [Ornithinimicrobium faecis]|uniref:Methyltransferase domain-containing protein n=2 Tax=Ornithinimicrobium faecis TaxID=2934158 RepID=A0ABY4YZJ9_9MICO|nr:methyltransferase domain-containing protein [Ornithinimicrobium sp. HY1793]USQ82169.1 methyltransferase domain-containing protein [Ornithinimicrobium sp. HY1793]
MQCDYFDSARCRSCSLMGTPYDEQLAAKQARCHAALGTSALPTALDTTPLDPGPLWEPPFASNPERFRNKAKLVVGGTRDSPTVGILDRGGEGIDLRHCGLYEPGLTEVVQQVPEIIADLGLVPYAVPHRSGELKHVLVTHSPAGELMVRFVLRSPGQVGRIERALPELQERLPGARVVSVNLQPTHAAVLEGPEEMVLTRDQELPMQVNDVRLRLRTRSFFQTNTLVAAGLYRQARDWINDVDPASLWDLYCGVGGFALHALMRPDGTPRDVLGVEVSPEAVESARAASAELPGRPTFLAGDVTDHLTTTPPPDLVVVNPPRRGIGADLAGWLESSGVEHVLYSSCNVDSLAADLARMPSLLPVRARLFDMFPQTNHLEVLTLLRRR